MYYRWGGGFFACQIGYDTLLSLILAVPVSERVDQQVSILKSLVWLDQDSNPFPGLSKREADALLIRPLRLVGNVKCFSLEDSDFRFVVLWRPSNT